MSRSDRQMHTQLYTPGADEEATKSQKMYDLVDQYRIFCQMTWKEFLYTAIANQVRDENPAIAEAIEVYLQTMRKPGRPKGSSVKQKLYRMGVIPD